MKNTTLTVTPLDDLRSYSEGEIVELPPFGEEQPFVARLKRPSMLVLMKTGKIPNALLGAATKIFSGDVDVDEIDDSFFKEMGEVFEVIAEAAFVEPTWVELKEIGLELTDEQRMAIFNYSQKGIRALEPFCV